MVTQSCRLVEYLGTFTLSLAEHMGSVEELAVKRRILAHEHGVKAGQCFLLYGNFFVPVFQVTRQAQLAHAGHDTATHFPADVLGLSGEHRVPTALRFTHHDKGRVFLGIEGVQRIGNKKKLHGLLGPGPVQ